MSVPLAKPLQILIVIWEVALVSIIVWRVVRAIRRSRSGTSENRGEDAFERIREAARTAFPFRPVADAIGYEIAVTAYALFGADRKLVLPGRAFSYHRKGGYGAVVSERADPLRPFEKGRSAIRATLFGAPRLVLHLKEPLVADGPYGRRRTVERVGFSVDSEAEFLAAMANPEAL